MWQIFFDYTEIAVIKDRKTNSYTHKTFEMIYIYIYIYIYHFKIVLYEYKNWFSCILWQQFQYNKKIFVTSFMTTFCSVSHSLTLTLYKIFVNVLNRLPSLRTSTKARARIWTPPMPGGTLGVTPVPRVTPTAPAPCPWWACRTWMTRKRREPSKRSHRRSAGRSNRWLLPMSSTSRSCQSLTRSWGCFHGKMTLVGLRGQLLSTDAVNVIVLFRSLGQLG